MPAPLAKGLLISLSVLFAAGIAVYENPQVRQWVDSSRRKIAIALHSLGDEITPSPPPRESPDASTREDESPDAVERRRKARQEIMERARIVYEKRRTKKEESEKPKTFDDLVDENGALRTEKEEATTTSAETKPESEQDLRQRHSDTTATNPPQNATINPFADDMHTDFNSEQEDAHPTLHTRSSTPTISPRPERQNPAPSNPHLLIDTEVTSNHPSESLVDLTPTTSTSSGAHADLSELAAFTPPAQKHWSVHEWAETAGPSFYSPPQSDAAGLEGEEGRRGFETPATGDHLSRVGSEANLDVWSDVGDRISTPGSWTEVGSVVSEDY